MGRGMKNDYIGLLKKRDAPRRDEDREGGEKLIM